MRGPGGGGAARTAVLAGVLLGGCARPERPPDVVLVTIDTARADRFSCMGESPVPTPRIDEVAAAGAAFVDAVSPVPMTLPAHATVLTGRLPIHHGVRVNGGQRLPEAETTLAERLRAAGWRTGAFVGAAVLDARYGLEQGFEVYDDRTEGYEMAFDYAQRRGERVVEAALDWLQGLGRDEPAFLWVHLYDPHFPYAPPEPERSAWAEHPYEGEIAYVDRVVGELLDGLDAEGRLERAVVAITSDHGESLGEHGEATHMVFVYEAAIRVPLVLRAPGLPGGVRVRAPVGLADVAPTLLELAGLDAAGGPALDGRSLVAAARGEPVPWADERGLYVETLGPYWSYRWAPLRGLRAGGWKYVLGAADELYDLRADPGERRDLAAAEPERAAGMRARLEREFADPGPRPDAALAMDAESRAELAALGYAPSDLGFPASTEGLPDPRDRVALLDELARVAADMAQGRAGAAAERAGALAARDPGNPWFARVYAEALAQAGRLGETLGAYERAAALAPEDPALLGNLGVLYEMAGRNDDALAAYERAIAADPTDTVSRHNRWRLLLLAGRNDVVAAEAQRRLEEAPGDAEARAAWLRARHPGGGRALVEALRAAVAERPDEGPLHLALAQALDASGDGAAALDEYAAVLRTDPANAPALLGRLRLLLRSGRTAEAGRLAEEALRLAVPTPDLLLAVAEARYRTGNVGGALEALDLAVRQAPGRADAWGTRGALLIASGRVAEGVAAYERAVALGLDDPATWRHLAMGYEALGRAADAARARARAEAEVRR